MAEGMKPSVVYNPDPTYEKAATKIKKEAQKTEAEVKKHICDQDENRAEYYRFYTGESWRDASHFDISLDSAALGEDGCVDRIVQALPIFTKA